MPPSAALLWTPEHQAQVVVHCLTALPDEGCGVLLGHGTRVTEVRRCVNAAHSPTRYEFDPREQFQLFRNLREHRLDLVGIFHSHPQSSAQPSATDVALAFYPDVAWVICSLLHPDAPDIQAFRIEQETGVITPLGIELLEGPA